MISCVHDILLLQCRNNPIHPALIDGQRRASYAAVLRQAEEYAFTLTARGAKQGDHIALYLQRSVESVAALFAIWLLGGTAIILNDVLKEKQVHYILEHAEASLLITDTRLRKNLTDLTLDEHHCFITDEPQESGTTFSPVRQIGSDLALIIYTSGSTGMPKGIMLSHENLLSGTRIVSDYLHLTCDDRLISLLPFSFDYGLNQLLTAFFVGGSLVLQHSMMPADICNTLRQEEITGMAAVPMLWQQLAGARSPFIKGSFPSLRYITNTGGSMPESTTRLFRKIHPQLQIFLMYGLTEAFRSSYLPHDQVDQRPTSIGKAIPNVELLVINEQGERCKPGEEGELVHRGANIAMGYWRDAESTAQRFRPAPFQQQKGGQPEIAVYSGDFVKTDEEGFLYFIGRKDQMIKSHGMRVSPEEIEHYLFTSGLLTHVAVFAVTSVDGTSQIIAAIVPKDPAIFTTQQIQQFCKTELPEYLRPAVFWSVPAVPQTSSGKPDRIQLRKIYNEQHNA